MEVPNEPEAVEDAAEPKVVKAEPESEAALTEPVAEPENVEAPTEPEAEQEAEVVPAEPCSI